MKKIITAEQTREADQWAIQNEPISSIDLMERASHAFVNQFKQYFSTTKRITVIAGPGNNGGDALAIARILSVQGYTLRCLILDFGKATLDNETNRKRLACPSRFISSGDTLELDGSDVIIDGVFGSGLSRPVQGWLADQFELINQSTAFKVSIDIPSGLFSNEINQNGAIIKADRTISFQRPKLTFMLPETGNYCGEFDVVNIGLDEGFIESRTSQFYLLESQDIHLPKRKKFDHKGVYGHVKLFVGSKGKMGAAYLSGKASLKVGVGLCTLHLPQCGLEILQTNLPEAMVEIDDHENVISTGRVGDKNNVVCIGPGIGTDPLTKLWLAKFLEELEVPAVLDADAINIIAEQQHLLDFLPSGSILTPHLGELSRLIGETNDSLGRIAKVKALSQKHHIYILIKGAHSAIVTPSEDVVFNYTGNPGMATAGSGDVLSGMISGLLAQGMGSEDALKAAVYLHGSSGDLAKNHLGEVSIMASDLLNFIPKSISNVS